MQHYSTWTESSLWAKNHSGVQEKRQAWRSMLPPPRCLESTHNSLKVWQAKRGSQQPEVSLLEQFICSPVGGPMQVYHTWAEQEYSSLWLNCFQVQATNSTFGSLCSTFPRAACSSCGNTAKKIITVKKKKSCPFSIACFLLELMTVVKNPNNKDAPQPPIQSTPGNLACSLAWLWAGRGVEHQAPYHVRGFGRTAFPCKSDSQLCFLVFKLTL